MIAWVDIETTGLDEETGQILEIAVAVTDDDLVEVLEGPSLVIEVARPDYGALTRRVAAMDPVVVEMHEKSGLLEALRHPDFCVSLEEAERRCADFFMSSPFRSRGQRYVSIDECSATLREMPLAGSGVHFDRRWLRRHMPVLEGLFHYRNLDVSSLKEAAKRWAPLVYDTRPRDEKAHRAMPDVRHSIEELRHYRRFLFGRDRALRLGIDV